MSTRESDAARVFLEAVEQVGPEQRQAFVDDACRHDPELRARVTDLLQAHGESNALLDDNQLIATLAPPPLETPGTMIGPYKLLDQIGEGGFGVVFMAEQERPVRRKVALKVIKPGMDTRQVIGRFEAERQALALMDHPGIAKVFDSGTTENGRPYFVMELVRGVPITEYCDQCNLTTRDRLELFVTVCQAVQHAHQKGVIHRDLKPTNVLVSMQDDKPAPKIIDFGVAKAIDQRLTDETLTTAFAQMVGTPLYMSPEQAELSPMGVDTRSDVYSLGVLLYELLTGTTPFDKDRLRAAPYDELRRIIRQEEPPRPSTRISTLAADLATTIADRRRTEVRRLLQTVHGELDWIVMKAMEKDRSRRYESVSSFAHDIEHYLNDEPVQACPPSTAYRFRKFARRNKGPVLAAGLILLALVGGIFGTTWQAVRATAAKALAEQRLAQAERSNEILGSIFLDLDPRRGKYGKPLHALLGERLQQAAAQLDAESVGDPLAVARLQNSLGASMLPLSHIGPAIGLLEKSLHTRESLLGPDHADTLDSMHNLAWALAVDGQNDRALPLFEQVYAKRMEKLGPEHIDTVITSFHLAGEYLRVGQRDKGLPLLERAQAKCHEIRGPDDAMSLYFTSNLAVAYSDIGQFDKALPLFETTLTKQREMHGPDDVGALITMVYLANAYRDAGQVDKALPLLEDALDRSRKTLGADHHETQHNMHCLALAYRDRGDYAQAEALLLEALDLRKQKFAADHPAINYTKANLVQLYEKWDKPEEAAKWRAR